ncbi:MAG: DUF599 domain-containing protein [Deltaproteobacteria bacterium]|nr:DUF599 domain-containing protein [Deltaproteobacteria bacterium]
MSTYDTIALGLFLFLYLGYQLFFLLAPALGLQTREQIVLHYRRRWFQGVLADKNYILAIQTIRNLEMVTTFLGSVTLLMMGGVVGLFFSNPEWLDKLNHGRYTDFLVAHPLGVKLLVVLVVLAAAFLNFIISLRITYNMNFVLSAPIHPKEGIEFQMDQVRRQTRYFFVGVRSLYFSIAPLMWVLDTNLFIASSLSATILTLRSDLLRQMPPLFPLRRITDRLGLHAKKSANRKNVIE